ncbi:MAG TPA: FAD-binding protein [Nocardioides sp.]|nr:FAD-binding protein [Nocardioides sp.]
MVRLRLPRGRPVAGHRHARRRSRRPPRGRHLGQRRLARLAAEIPVAALVETVERFNRFAETGVDEEFHRGEDEYDTFFATGAGPNKALLPLDSPPYFAARFVLSDLGTKGGLVTDAAGRVLQENGAPLPGLYAAGNTASSVFGSVYPGPGAPLGSAMVFAALAVEDMAR